MPYLERSQIQKGMLLTAPGGPCESPRIQQGVFMVKDGGRALVKRSTPRGPVRYGDNLPDSAALNSNLDDMKARIEKLRADLARQRS